MMLQRHSIDARVSSEVRPGDRPGVRPGAYLIELTLVVMIFIMFFFGVLEYSRLIFVRQLIVNATREGARYAVANVTDTTVDTDTQALVKTKMNGFDTVANCNYSCSVYESTSAGAYVGSTANAAFGDYICVQVDYTYTPLLPSMLFMSSSFKMTFKDVMLSEAN